MDTAETITLTRQQLYDQVWSIPMVRLAKTLNLSDVGLAKVCRKHLIPCPPVGYWAKKQHGKKVRQTPLPPCDDPGLQSIRFYQNTPQSARPEVPVVEPEYDPDVMNALARIRTIEKVEVKTELRNLHPLVQSTREAFREAIPDQHNLLFPHREEGDEVISVHVAQESVKRAMLYLDALIRTFEKVGGSVEIKTERWHFETRIRILGESPMVIRLRERYRQKEKPKEAKTRPWDNRMDYFPSGLFVLEGNPNWHWRVLCQDGKRSRVEDCILTTITEWVTAVGKGRIERRRTEEARRIQEEKDRIRREQEQELQRRRAELAAKQKQERDKVESLLHEANSWYQSKTLREYIREVERSAAERHGTIEENSEMFQWLQWAGQQADRLDPLRPSPPSILDERIG
jgi:hypothetical protein